MEYKFNHFNFNVKNLDESIKFYNEALGLKEIRRKEASDGSFTIVFMGDGSGTFSLELTCLKDHPQAYDLGECEFHLALTADDYEASTQKSIKRWTASDYINEGMGIYFIADRTDIG